jgi:hypothetical protein
MYLSLSLSLSLANQRVKTQATKVTKKLREREKRGKKEGGNIHDLTMPMILVIQDGRGVINPCRLS